MSARICVVVPVFDDGRTLPGALASLQAQTRLPDEVLVVDDGSTDPRTLALLGELERIPPLPGLRVIRQSNQGVAAARQAGIALATGEYLLPLDADDELLPGALQALERALEAHPEASFAHGPVRYFGAVRGDAVPPRFNPYLELDENPMLPVALFRLRVFRELGLRYAPLKAFEDWGLWLACAGAGLQGADVPEPVYRYRRKRGEGLMAWAEPRRAQLEGELRGLFPALYAPEGRAALKRAHAPALELAFDGSPQDPALGRFLAGQRFDDMRVRGAFQTAQELVQAARGRFVLLLSPAHLPLLAGARPSCLWQLALGLEAHPEAAGFVLSTQPAALGEGALGERLVRCAPDADVPGGLVVLRTQALAGLREAHLMAGAPVAELAERAKRRGALYLLREDLLGLRTAPGDESPPAGRAHKAPAPWTARLARVRPLWTRVRRRLEREAGEERVGRLLHPVKEALGDSLGVLDAAGTALGELRLPRSLARLLSPCARAEREWLERVPVRLDELRPPVTAAGGPRVLVSVPWVVTGGVDRATIELAQILHERGYRLLLATHNVARHEWLPRLRPFLDDHALLGELCAPARRPEALVSLARSWGADAVFLSHSWPGLEALPALKARLTRVRTVDFQHMDDPRPGAQFAQVSCERYDHLLDLRLVAHDFLARRYASWGVPAAKVRTIHLGCDEQGACDPARVPVGHLRGALRLPIPPGAPVVGFVGRMAFEKDPVFVVRVYAALSRALLSAGTAAPHFVLVGDGELLAAAQAEAAALGLEGRAHFLPPDSDVPAVLRDLSLLLMASRLEGLPLVFFEALALGTPVVTTAVQGIGELIDSEVGACVPELPGEDARLRALVEAALPYLREPRERARASAAARSRIVTRFSSQARREKIISAFETLLGSR